MMLTLYKRNHEISEARCLFFLGCLFSGFCWLFSSLSFYGSCCDDGERVSWLGLVCWSWVWSVNRSGFVIDWSRVVWSWVVWGWVGFVYWGRLVVNWGRDRFVCRDWSGFVGRFWEGLISRSWVRHISRSWVRFVGGFVLRVSGFSLVTNIG